MPQMLPSQTLVSTGAAPLRSASRGALAAAVLLTASCTCGGPPEEPTGPPPAPDEVETALLNLIEERRLAVFEAEDSGDTWGELGKVFDAHLMKEEARRCYERAAELDPEAPAWPYHLAMQVVLDDPAAALANLERVVELEDGYASAWARLGHARLLSDQLDGAMEAFSRAIELQPTWVAPLLGRARVELALDEAGTALGDLERALEAGPVTSEVHSLMAEAYRRVGQQGRSDAAAALAGDKPGSEPLPDSWRDAVGKLAITYESVKPVADAHIAAGRLDDAYGCWNRVLQYDPESLRGHRERALVQVLRGNTDAGLVGFDRAAGLARAAGNKRIEAGVASAKGAAFLAVRDTEGAIKAFEQALELDPQLHQARGSLGAILSGGPDVERGIDLLRGVCVATPKDASVHFSLGMALFGLGRYEEAREAFSDALRLDSEFGAAYFQTGLSWSREQRWDEAAASFSRAAQVDPAHRPSWSNWARALREAGRWVDAVAVQKDAVLQLPEALELKRELAWDLATAPEADARDGAEARRISEEINREVKFADPRMLDNLAACYAEMGMFEGARSHLTKAIRILSEMDSQRAPRSRPSILRAMRKRLAGYEAERPWRQ